jgi:hypothetical protein
MTDRTTYAVDPARLEYGVWNHDRNKDEGEGDIRGAYSADTIATSGHVRKPFKHEGALWTVTSTQSKGRAYEAEAYRLLQAFKFAGKQTTYREKTLDSEAARNDPDGFYHGIKVNFAKHEMVLCGPPARFVADQAASRPEAKTPEPEQLGLF